MIDEHALSGHHGFSIETEYGHRCLPTVLDDISKRDPHRLYAVVPNSDELADGFKSISFKEMAHCVDYFAHVLEKNIGRSAVSETVAYIGVPDLRNAIVFLAAVKCGFKVTLRN